MSNSRLTFQRLARKSIPIPIFLGMVYLSWAYSYYICWNEIYKHHSKATGIGLIIGNIAFILLIYFIWLQILIMDPGVQPKMPVFKLLEDGDDASYRWVHPPEYFMCDAHGYPTWCNTCQSIKVDRSHHSSDLNRCVARMDHYCTFLGTTIGKRNYRLFLQFCFWYLCYFIYIGVSMACFTRSYKIRHGSVNANTIILYVASLGWIILIFALFSSHIYYIFKNRTSIDDMAAKRNRRAKSLNDEFINISHEEKRYVLRVSSMKDEIWNKGFAKNWVEIMGNNMIFWIIPWRSPLKHLGDESSNDYYSIIGDYKEEISESFKKSLVKRIQADDYISSS